MITIPHLSKLSIETYGKSHRVIINSLVFFYHGTFFKGAGEFTRFMLPHDSGHEKFPEDSEKMLHPLLLYSFLCRRDASPMIYKYFFLLSLGVFFSAL